MVVLEDSLVFAFQVSHAEAQISTKTTFCEHGWMMLHGCSHQLIAWLDATWTHPWNPSMELSDLATILAILGLWRQSGEKGASSTPKPARVRHKKTPPLPRCLQKNSQYVTVFQEGTKNTKNILKHVCVVVNGPMWRHWWMFEYYIWAYLSYARLLVPGPGHKLKAPCCTGACYFPMTHAELDIIHSFIVCIFIAFSSHLSWLCAILHTCNSLRYESYIQTECQTWNIRNCQVFGIWPQFNIQDHWSQSPARPLRHAWRCLRQPTTWSLMTTKQRPVHLSWYHFVIYWQVESIMKLKFCSKSIWNLS